MIIYHYDELGVIIFAVLHNEHSSTCREYKSSLLVSPCTPSSVRDQTIWKSQEGYQKYIIIIITIIIIIIIIIIIPT